MIKKYFYFSLIVLFFSSNNQNSKNFESASIASYFDVFSNSETEIDSNYIKKFNDTTLLQLYRTKNFEFIWKSKENRDLIIDYFIKCESEGLAPNDYFAEYFFNLETKFETLSNLEKTEYDVQLSRSLQKFIKHLNQGKLDPYKLYEDWDLGKKTTNINSVFLNGIDNNDFKNQLENLNPKIYLYQNLKETLENLNKIKGDNFDQLKLLNKINPNTSSSEIVILKKKLIFWGELAPKEKLTQLYDKETLIAVKKFQKRHGLKADGVIGKGTIEALNFSKSQRIQQVVANMERLRWMPNNIGNHFIFVNIPNYKLTVFKEKDSLFSKRVVVGKTTRQTPMLSSKISNIVLNPNWTVPPTILKEDIFPIAVSNKSIFARKGLKIMDYKNNVVSPYKWKLADAKKYKYVQNPSGNNALGYLKINFPNKYAVYLHDTNHRNDFSKQFRALSSGCVRIEKPLELGAYIINDTINWSLEKIKDATVNSKKTATKSLNIEEEINIYFNYITAWTENKKLNFREDIYCLDSDLYTKLRY